MLVGISTEKLCEERGVETWEYSLECTSESEDSPKAFCGTFTIDVRFTIEEPEDSRQYGYSSCSFSWFWADFNKTAHNLELMKAWAEDHHEELENALNKGYIEIETK